MSASDKQVRDAREAVASLLRYWHNSPSVPRRGVEDLLAILTPADDEGPSEVDWAVARAMDRQAEALMTLSKQHRGGMAKGLVRAAQAIGGGHEVWRLADEA